MQAIPTRYNGIEYKSRLEARWAVFFDALNIEYYYEYEGFQLTSGWYLPDFYLPKIEMWVEIKGGKPTKEEERMASELSVATDKRVIIIYGDMKVPVGDYYKWTHIELYGPKYGDNLQMWCECARCGKIDVQFEGRANRIECECPPAGDDKGHNFASERLVDAYMRALKYQFVIERRGRK